MPLISDAEYDDLEALWNGLEPSVARSTSVAAATQLVIDALYERFGRSVALVRAFTAVEFRHLQPDDRRYVEEFTRRETGEQRLDDGTPVLTLLATRGAEDAWNDRTRSEGHRAIPLLSEEFIAGIPMIARLLREIGFTPSWSGPAGFVTKTLANVNGVFYVGDARSAVDEHDRAIIPATDFVDRYDVRTVFGVGGTYLSRSAFLCIVMFCRENILRSQTMKFVPLVGSLKAATTRLINRGAFFPG